MKTVNYGYSNYSVGEIGDLFISVVNETGESWPIRKDHITKIWAIETEGVPLSTSC